jgi:hypothetical protein
MGGFLDRELTTFQTQAAIGKEISVRITVLQKCDASVFTVVKCQHSMGNTQAMFYVSGKELRLYHGLDFLGEGACERCERCIQVLPQYGMRRACDGRCWLSFFVMQFFYSPQFKMSTTQGAYRWSGDATFAVPAKDRVEHTEHEPLAFEC